MQPLGPSTTARAQRTRGLTQPTVSAWHAPTARPAQVRVCCVLCDARDGFAVHDACMYLVFAGSRSIADCKCKPNFYKAGASLGTCSACPELSVSPAGAHIHLMHASIRRVLSMYIHTYVRTYVHAYVHSFICTVHAMHTKEFGYLCYVCM